MKWIYLFLFAFFLSSSLSAQEINTLIREAERQESQLQEKEALRSFKEALKLQPLNVYVLSKCSELCSRIGHRESDHRLRDEYYEAAAIYAKTALKYYPNNDEAHVSMAIALGRTALTKSGKEKIAQVKEIRSHADRAIQLNPNNFKAWHVIGKWYYEVANLNFVEKSAVKLFYGGLPKANWSLAIHAYEKARALKPDFMLNYLELARAYHKNDENEKAIAQLKTLLQLNVKTADDTRIKEEASQLLASWE